ncbi:hypothetical protein Taro_027548 [Colocasia esculenta]|uniref:Uncharacterized protein n=1 Tax=Colocasia esculenta TaxID=4460 RepID=A0A843VID9_COLES|nr:hypothetical protein [Colocasia esculenta]
MIRRRIEILGLGASNIEKTAAAAAAAADVTAVDVCCRTEEKPDQLLPAGQQGLPVPQLPPLQVQPVLHRPGQAGGAGTAAATLMALFPPLQMLRPTCQQLSPTSVPSKQGTLARKRVVGTLYGQRKGRAIFAVQDDPSSEEPLLLLELAVATGQLVKEMASGTVRILLECERQPLDTKKTTNKKKKKEQIHQPASQSPPRAAPLWEEPLWTMFCNGRKSGCATPRPCGDTDRHVLRTVRAVSAGAGVLPLAAATEAPPPPAAQLETTKGKKAMTEGSCQHGGGGSGSGNGNGGDGGACNQEMMYMRAKFERVVVSKDSEAFYMMSPSGCKAGSPELSIILLRS